MPFIKSKVSCKVSLEKESELKVRLGQAIEIIPGKSEQYFYWNWKTTATYG